MNSVPPVPVRIRIQTDCGRIVIHAPGGFSLRGSAGFQGETEATRLECSLQQSVPAAGRHWFKLALATNEEHLGRQQSLLAAAAIESRLIRYGEDPELHPGREQLYLLLAAPLDDSEGRVAARIDLQKRLPAGCTADFHSADDLLFVVEQPAVSRWRLRCGELTHTSGGMLQIAPRSPGDLLRVEQVRIGIDFHWDHTEELAYSGTLELQAGHSGRLCLVNAIDLEEYLASVNSSEMTADSPPALLQAQTIAARSTLLATRGRHHWGEPFDLCSDDHCQCYHGALRIAAASRQAAQSTRGQVLVAGDQVVDARYSKSCGGIVEAYRHVWEERDPPALVSFPDGDASVPFPADSEEKARRLIDGDFVSHCSVKPEQLPAGLQYAGGYSRWEVCCENRELTQLVNQALGTDWERIDDLQPLERGDSGRIKRLLIVSGREQRCVEGELTIRRTLSSSHLYSSLFYVVREGDRFRLRGAGWGHGVGLCQLGATALALSGSSCAEILRFYYPGSRLETLRQR